MRKVTAVLLVFLTTAFASNNMIAQGLPDLFQGKIVDQGKKPAWIPDGSGISYTKGDSLFIYDKETEKPFKLVEMDIAEYIWLNDDSVLALEWPENVRTRKPVSKIVNYWIIEKDSDTQLFAADTTITERIPSYKSPFRLPDGKVAIRKDAGWDVADFPVTDQYVVFADSGYDIEKGLSGFSYLSSSDVEGGSIHFKNINEEAYRTIQMGKLYGNPELSPNHAMMTAFADETLYILDSMGSLAADLSNHVEVPGGYQFRKFIGPVWNSASDGIAYYELFENGVDYYTVSYFDLETGKKSTISQVDYYGQKNMEFSPDDKQIVSRYVHNGMSHIVLMDVPEISKGEAK